MSETNPIPGVDFPFTVWEVTNLERTLPDGDVFPNGTVFAAAWMVSHHEGGLSAFNTGTVKLAPAEATSFTPYGDITKEQAVEWVKATLGDKEVTALEKSVKNRVKAKLAPTKANGLPW